ncbi:MFS family permease [Povalibacter uvarum]|uniref:MFS family permease n=1 Tax=Povalibacter uvarum TaxID=732238 RepID=A0A841HR83_9GAMM|nr:MFS transporter [Povalibacter uvarum]MBB6095747.1 MFS family permease [Povalibacter uvarum]
MSADSPTAAAASPPRSFAALRHRGYRGFFFSMAGAMMADSIEHVISYWVIFEKFNSPALNGFAIVSHWLPFLLFSVYAGALADRFDPRRLIQIGMVIFMLVSIAWGVLFLTDTLQMWHAAVLLVAHGIAGVLWSPPSQVLLHDIVPRDQLQSAVRLNATSRYLGMLFGPAVGGGILLLLGPEKGILFNALLYLPTILWLWKAPYGPKFRTEQGPPPRAIRGLTDIIAAIRNVAADRTLLSMTLLAGGASLFVGTAYQAQMPGFAHDLGHGDADLSYSLLLSADAAGALTAGLLLESRGLLQPNPRTAFLLAIVWCCALAGFAMSNVYGLSMALLFVAGFVELSFFSMAQTLVQLRAPPEVRGRVIGVYSMAALGMRTFSGVTIGVVGAMIGIHWSLALSATLLLTLILTLAAFSLRPRPA